MAVRKQKPIICESYLMIDGVPHEWKSLSEEARKAACKRMNERAAIALSDYYSSHPEEIENLFKMESVISIERVEPD